MRDIKAEATQARAPALVLIFENIRNMFLCLGLALVGLAVAYVPGLSFLGWPWSHWLGLLIGISASGLFVASLIDLWSELTRGALASSPKRLFVVVPLLLAYSIAVGTCYSAAIRGLAQPMLALAAPNAGAGEAKDAPKAEAR